MSDRTADLRLEDSLNDPPKCERCDGTGEVPAVASRSLLHLARFGTTIATRTCPDCGGKGIAGADGKGAKT